MPFLISSVPTVRAQRWRPTSVCKQAGLLTTQPGLGRISRVKGLRELVVGNYILVYQVVDQDIYVIRVLHGAQDWGAWSVKTMHEPLANYGRER